MLGYLEQTVAMSVINSLSAVGTQKPKFPFLTSTKSALYYVACHLKGMWKLLLWAVQLYVINNIFLPIAFNPRSSVFVRNKFKKKIAQFEEQCELIVYLSSQMKQGYNEPINRPVDFNFKMNTFLKLQNVKWIHTILWLDRTLLLVVIIIFTTTIVNMCM